MLDSYTLWRHTISGMEQMLTPADVVFALIGPPEVVGPICDLSQTVAYVWRRSAGERRDAGDIPSARHMRKLLAHARAHAIPLTAEHLIFGASRAELDALLAQRPAPAPTLAAE